MTASSPSRCYGDGLHLLGVNHRTLPIAGRERLARPKAARGELLRRLCSESAIVEAAVLSTCNRFELIAVGPRADERLADLMREYLGNDIDPACLYGYRDASAVRHLFRVAASLDSLVLGEAQILGQVKEAYREAVACGTAGRYLHKIFQCAFAVAKKVRSQTEIGGHSLSVSYVAVQLARQIFGTLAGRRVLVIGSGAMAELAVLQLKRSGCANIIVANRSVAHAEELAQRIGGSAVGLDELPVRLAEVDMVIASAATERPLIDLPMLQRLARTTPLFMIDLGVPRNLAPALAACDNVYLYNVDDLGAVADRHRELREEAAGQAEVIIEYALLQFERRLLRVQDQPELLDLRSRVRQICSAELVRELRQALPGPLLEAKAGLLAHRISQKISHELVEKMLAAGNGRFNPISLLPLFIDQLLDEEQ